MATKHCWPQNKGADIPPTLARASSKAKNFGTISGALGTFMIMNKVDRQYFLFNGHSLSYETKL
jgi:hypothetical protein